MPNRHDRRHPPKLLAAGPHNSPPSRGRLVPKPGQQEQQVQVQAVNLEALPPEIRDHLSRLTDGSAGLVAASSLPQERVEDSMAATPRDPQSGAPADNVIPIEKRAAKRGRPPGSGGSKAKPITAPAVGVVPEVRVGSKTEAQEMTEGLTQLYGTIGTFVMFVNQYDGLIILNNANAMANSVVAACRPYEQAWKVLGMVVRGNVFTVVALAHLGPLVAISANHGLISPQAVAAFRQPEPPARGPSPGVPAGNGMGTFAAPSGPVYEPPVNAGYAYPDAAGAGLGSQDYTPEQVQAFIAQAAAQAGQLTPQQYRADQQPAPYVPTPGSVGMDSAGGMGDAANAAARQAFSADLIAKIREEAIRKTLLQQQTGQTNGL